VRTELFFAHDENLMRLIARSAKYGDWLTKNDGFGYETRGRQFPEKAGFERMTGRGQRSRWVATGPEGPFGRILKGWPRIVFFHVSGVVGVGTGGPNGKMPRDLPRVFSPESYHVVGTRLERLPENRRWRSSVMPIVAEARLALIGQCAFEKRVHQ